MKPLPFRCLFTGLLLTLLFTACDKPSSEEEIPAPSQPKLIFKFRFDSTQVRLNELGQPEDVPAGHAAQNPRFNTISAHYLELTPSQFTPLGDGTVLYTGTQTSAG